MNNLEKNIFYAKNLQEIFYSLKNIKNLKLIGGATGLETLPEKSLSIINIPELKKISKHERYIEFGPATSLSQILNLGERHIPKILFDALSTIANPFVRNIATIGGNIMGDFWYHTLYAPLLALDARLELKTENETTYKMEQIYKQGTEQFVQFFINEKFKCSKVEYHSKTNRIKYMLFEQI